MNLRQVILLGGAALVLAACADSTAPTTQMHRGGVEAAGKQKAPVTKSTIPQVTNTFLDCERTGYQVTSGRSDSSCGGQ